MKSVMTLVWTLVLLASTVPSYAGTLDAELDHKVQAIAKFLKAKNFNSVTLNPIRGLPQAAGTNRINALIQDKLLALDIQSVGMGAGAPVQLNIDLEFVGESSEHSIPVLLIEIELRTSQGQKMREWSGTFEFPAGDGKFSVVANEGTTTAEINNADDVAIILSIPHADHDLPLDEKKANKIALQELHAAYVQPSVSFIKDNRVSSHESGLYQMEIVTTRDPKLVDQNYLALTPTIQNGIPFAELTKGDMIGVRLFNNSDEKVAVEICLDGISSFQFSAAKGLRHYLIPPHKSILVRGFHQSFDKKTSIHQYKHFQIVDYADSAWLKAQQAGFASVSETQQGSISAHFSKENPLTRKNGDATRRLPLIGEGTALEEKAKVEEMSIGPVCETVVVRYHKPPAQ